MSNSNNPNIIPEDSGQQNDSGNMYSYRDNNSQEVKETGAIRRSIGEGNPNINYNQNNFGSGYLQNFNNSGNVAIQYNQEIQNNNDSFFLLPYLIIGFIEIVIIIILAFLFYYKIKFKENDILNYNYGLLRDMNIMVFIGFGMLHSILRRNSWISITINMLIIAFSVQFALFFNFLWKKAFKEDWLDENFDFIYLMKAIFISSSVLITLGCLLGKLSIIQYIILAIFETVLCSLNYQLCQEKLKIIDFGGALYIHTFGAIFGIAASTVLFCSSKIKASFKNFSHLNKSNYFSNLTSFLGMIFLFCYFPSFNSALEENSDFREKGRLNTYFSLFGSVIGSFITSGLFNTGRFVLDEILFGSISGAIIISGCCTICLYHWAAIIVGTLGGIISVLFLSKVKTFFIKWGLQDTCNIIIIHGINGLLGGLLTPIFISGLNYNEDNQNEYKNYLFGREFNSQAGIQIGAMFITIGISFIGGVATGYLMKISLCGKLSQYFTDAEFFLEEENNIFDYVEQNTGFNVEINNPSLFKMEYPGYNNQRPNGPDMRGSQPSY